MSREQITDSRRRVRRKRGYAEAARAPTCASISPAPAGATVTGFHKSKPQKLSTESLWQNPYMVHLLSSRVRRIFRIIGFQISQDSLVAWGMHNRWSVFFHPRFRMYLQYKTSRKSQILHYRCIFFPDRRVLTLRCATGAHARPTHRHLWFPPTGRGLVRRPPRSPTRLSRLCLQRYRIAHVCDFQCIS